ncbi:hypothetical protein M3650_13890 [Paenibacillus sp. MER TA 81-3]|uniref:hypothetical protein n=1 Tax=Paenibacillus sp. MER TA 81-3 TaxID=2939573 RepID=UPI00204011D6|nr:hypothetical protein [Paenibacillus sp. MER TA 81-3]MCM3339689.1 hypothetical protein [Paenibacillus sp. MER TA 81-3]
MEPQQRQWMKQEIARWRSNRLLPEVYCDFLDRLYELPEKTSDTASSTTSPASWVERIVSMSAKRWFTVFFISALICIVGFYFTVFAPSMQISVVLCIALLSIFIAARGRKRKPARAKGYAIIGCAAGSAGGILILYMQGWSEWWSVSICCMTAALLWLFSGWLIRSGWMQGMGWLGLALTYAQILRTAMTDITLLESQWLWLPECVLIVWLAWAVHRFSQSAAAGMLLGAIILWFMPELIWVNGLVSTQTVPDNELLFVLLVKLFIFFYFAYYFRKQWVKWLREHQTVKTTAMDRGLGA